MQREFLDLGQQLGLHLAHEDALLVHFRFGGEIGQVAVRPDVGPCVQRPGELAMARSGIITVC